MEILILLRHYFENSLNAQGFLGKGGVSDVLQF